MVRQVADIPRTSGRKRERREETGRELTTLSLAKMR